MALPFLTKKVSASSPILFAFLEDNVKSFSSLIEKGHSPYIELLPGMNSFAIARYLRKESFLKILDCVEPSSSFSSSSKETFYKACPSSTGLQYYSDLYFSSFSFLQKVSRYTQSLLPYLGKDKLWLGALFQQKMRQKEEEVFYVKESLPQTGYGLFAKKDLGAKEILGEYTGHVKKWGFLSYAPGDYRFQYPNLGAKRVRYVIDAEEAGGLVRFVNHSAKANVEAFSVYFSGLFHVIYWTVRPVKAHEELTVDYGEDYWKHREAPRLI